MPLLIRNLELNKIEWASLVDRGASGNPTNRPRIVLWKRSLGSRIKAALGLSKQTKPDDVCLASQEGVTMDPTLELALDQLKLNDEQKQAVLKMLEAAKGQPAAKPEQPKPPAGAAPSDPPMPPDIKKRFDEEAAKVVELEKRNKDLADKVEMMEFTKRAAELPYLPAKTEQVAAILKRASDANDKDLPDLLKRVNEAMKDSPALKEYGHGMGTDGKSAQDQLLDIAKRKREENPKLKASAAYAAAARENPSLYREARAE